MGRKSYQEWIDTFAGASQGGVDDPPVQEPQYSYEPDAPSTDDDGSPPADDDGGEPPTVLDDEDFSDDGDPDLDLEPDDQQAPPQMQEMLSLMKQQQDYIAKLEDRIHQSQQPKREGSSSMDALKARGIEDEETLKLLSAAIDEADQRAYDRIMKELGPVVGYTAQTAQDRQVMEQMAGDYGLNAKEQNAIAKQVHEARQNGSRASTEELHLAAMARVRARKTAEAERLAAARKKKREGQQRLTEPKNRQTKLVPDKLPDDEYEKMSWQEKVSYFKSLNSAK